MLYFTCDVQSSIETLNFSDGSACPCGVAVLSDPSRKAMYDRALLQQQRFDDAANGRDKVSQPGRAAAALASICLYVQLIDHHGHRTVPSLVAEVPELDLIDRSEIGRAHV